MQREVRALPVVAFVILATIWTAFAVAGSTGTPAAGADGAGGAATTVRAQPGALPARMNPDAAHTTVGGVRENDSVGGTAAAVGDVTDDRRADQQVGTPFDDSAAPNAGAAYLGGGRSPARDGGPTTATPTSTPVPTATTMPTAGPTSTPASTAMPPPGSPTPSPVATPTPPPALTPTPTATGTATPTSTAPPGPATATGTATRPPPGVPPATPRPSPTTIRAPREFWFDGFATWVAGFGPAVGLLAVALLAARLQ